MPKPAKGRTGNTLFFGPRPPHGLARALRFALALVLVLPAGGCGPHIPENGTPKERMLAEIAWKLDIGMDLSVILVGISAHIYAGQEQVREQYRDDLDDGYKYYSAYRAAKRAKDREPAAETGGPSADTNGGPGADIDKEALNRRLAALSQEDYYNDIRAFVAAYQQRDCNKLAGGAENLREALGDLVFARFLEEGFCVANDPARAAQIYNEHITPGSEDPIALARLGTLYLEGRGVPRDPEKARQYFDRAVITQVVGTWYDEPLYTVTSLHAADSLHFELWGLTEYQLRMEFASVKTGPWPLPEPLQRRLAEFEPCTPRGGDRLVAMARDLRAKSAPQSDEYAFAATVMAALSFKGHQAAAYYEHLWQLEETDCTGLTGDAKRGCDWVEERALEGLRTLALRGVPQALEYIITKKLQRPSMADTGDNRGEDGQESEFEPWFLYQYLKAAQLAGIGTYEALRAKTAARLTPLERKVLDGWVAQSGSEPLERHVP